MKKFLIAVLLILGIPFAFFLLYLNIVTKSFIESRGSRILGTDLSVGLVSVSPFTGSFNIYGIKAKSPVGFNAEDVFKLSHVYIKINLSSISKDTIIIEKLDIKEPEITYELSPIGHNVDIIKQNASSRRAPASGEENDPSKKVIIREVNIVNGKVNFQANLVFADTRKQTLPLPDVHLKGIGEKENGILAREAVVQILQPVIIAIPNLDYKALEGQLKSVTEDFKGSVETLKGYLDR